MPFDDDAEADNPGFRPPPHPDDRLWRHPSEMRAHPIVPLGAPSGRVAAVATTHRGGLLHNRWVCVGGAALAGAVAASAGVVALGIGERVIERPVTERVALGPTAPTVGDPADESIAGVEARVSPAVVGVGAGLDGGDGGGPSGSGVVVRDDGIVVTSAALVGEGPTPVRLGDGTTTSADLVGTDPTTGLAVLDLPGTGHATAVLAGEASLAEGETAYTLAGPGEQADPGRSPDGAADTGAAGADASLSTADAGATGPAGDGSVAGTSAGGGVAPGELALADSPPGTRPPPGAAGDGAAGGTGTNGDPADGTVVPGTGGPTGLGIAPPDGPGRDHPAATAAGAPAGTGDSPAADRTGSGGGPTGGDDDATGTGAGGSPGDDGGLGTGDPADIGTGLVATTQRYIGPSGIALDGLVVEGDADPATLGGPVVNGRGALVGVVTAVQRGDTWYVAPVEVVDKVADDLLTFGQAHHGWLGIEGTDVPASEPGTLADESGGADPEGTGDSTTAAGTRVASVVPDSPADRGGLRPGDVIVAVDDTTVAHMPDLVVALRCRSPGDRVDVTVTRADGSRATLVLTLGEAPPPGP